MASALRSAILRHVRVPISQSLSLNGSRLTAVRSMSSHGDDHLDKKEVLDRVLDVVKSFPKVDPSKVDLMCTSYLMWLNMELGRQTTPADHNHVTPNVHFQKDLGLDSLDTVEI
ncbi:Acyl carrier protein 1, mitochondrial [Sesamum angolense]|uniref:Acyl carrier protein 1, mitochondrial n=1 Tax=Sesamum angolense TaxID=2727404 RepID=A0AAE2BTE2_9LAMI|nr:Acyl carrier protein 1, mitochondrial [Sesamum angolense]